MPVEQQQPGLAQTRNLCPAQPAGDRVLTCDVLSAGETRVVPVVQEQIEIATSLRSEGAVRVRKHVETHAETVELPGWAERAHVERIPIDQPADAVRGPRREGDAWVVPIYEERWVTVRQLYLREELRIATVREPQPRSESVSLLRERVCIERQDPLTGEWHPTPEFAAPGTSDTATQGDAP